MASHPLPNSLCPTAAGALEAISTTTSRRTAILSPAIIARSIVPAAIPCASLIDLGCLCHPSLMNNQTRHISESQLGTLTK